MEPIFLRALEFKDLERTHKWHSDPELYSTLIGTFHFVSRATEEEWLRMKQAASSREVNLAICMQEDSRHIGNIYLQDIDWVARHAGLGILIGEPDQRSKGYGQAAVRLLIKYAIQDLGLQRLHLLVLHENRPAIKVYEKCGFVVEGTLRKHVFKNGEFKDVLFMGLCANDPAPNARYSTPAPSGGNR